MRFSTLGLVLSAMLVFGSVEASPTFNNQQVNESVAENVISVTLGEKFTLTSSILNEEREIIVHLPDDYHTSNKPYPVIYLLDGNRHFQHAVTAKNILAEQELMPDSIVVAITNNRGTRGRDLGRGNKAFQQFISQDVIKYVDKQYRTQPFRTLFGHSMAGAFTINVLATEPDLFNQYIAASPFLQVNDEYAITNFAARLSKNDVLTQSLYFTLTNQNAEGKEATQALAKLRSLLTEKATSNMHWRYEFIQEQVHMTTPYLTLYAGLAFVNQAFRVPTFDSHKAFAQAGGYDGLKRFYQQRSQQYGGDASVPERVVRRMAFSFMNNEPQAAIQLFAQNAKRHPESPGALFGLGRGYENNNESEQALVAYEGALALAKQQNASSVSFLARQVTRYKKVIADEANH